MLILGLEIRLLITLIYLCISPLYSHPETYPCPKHSTKPSSALALLDPRIHSQFYGGNILSWNSDNLQTLLVDSTSKIFTKH